MLEKYSPANNVEPTQAYHQKLFKTQSVSAIKVPNVAETSQDKTQESGKVSIITEFFPPDYAATGQLIEELVKQLEKLGLSIEVFTGQPSYAFSKAKAPSVEKFGDIRIQRSRSTQAWSGRIRGKATSGVLFTICASLHLVKNNKKHDMYLVTSAPPFFYL